MNKIKSFILILFFFTGIGRAKEKTKAPEFTINTIHGQKVSLSDFNGKPVILDFWAETMYLLAFFDVGNSWQKYHDLRPFIVKKGVGIGFRMEMPMLGIIGFDLGYGIDNDGGKWVPHIQFGTQF